MAGCLPGALGKARGGPGVAGAGVSSSGPQALSGRTPTPQVSSSQAFLWGGPGCSHPRGLYQGPQKASPAKHSSVFHLLQHPVRSSLCSVWGGDKRGHHARASYPPVHPPVRCTRGSDHRCGHTCRRSEGPAPLKRDAAVSSVNIHPPGAVIHWSVLITGLFLHKLGSEAQYLCLQDAGAPGCLAKATPCPFRKQGIPKRRLPSVPSGSPQRMRDQRVTLLQR